MLVVQRSSRRLLPLAQRMTEPTRGKQSSMPPERPLGEGLFLATPPSFISVSSLYRSQSPISPILRSKGPPRAADERGCCRIVVLFSTLTPTAQLWRPDVSTILSMLYPASGYVYWSPETSGHTLCLARCGSLSLFSRLSAWPIWNESSPSLSSNPHAGHLVVGNCRLKPGMFTARETARRPQWRHHF